MSSCASSIPAQPAAVDRYRTFKGIDFEGQARRVLERIGHHTRGSDNPFWAYFYQRRNATTGMRYDDQLLLSSFVNQIRELFEEHGDEAALAWLDQLENECF